MYIYTTTIIISNKKTNLMYYSPQSSKFSYKQRTGCHFKSGILAKKCLIKNRSYTVVILLFLQGEICVRSKKKESKRQKKEKHKTEGRVRIYRQIRRELKQNEYPFYRQIFLSLSPMDFTTFADSLFRLLSAVFPVYICFCERDRQIEKKDRIYL